MSWFDEFRQGFTEDALRGPDDQAKQFYESRDLQNLDDDAIRLEKYFAEAVAKHINSGKSTEIKPSDINTARSLTKAVEDIGYSYQSLMKKLKFSKIISILTSMLVVQILKND